jgi:bacillolysin
MSHKYSVATFLLLSGLACAPAYAQDAARAADKVLAQDGTPTLVRFKPEAPTYSLNEARKAFVEQLQLTPDDQMRAAHSEIDNLGFTHEKYQQYYKGIKVEHATYTLHARQGKVESMSGKVEHIQHLNVTPTLAATTALHQALAFVGARQYMWDDPAAEAALRQEQNNPAATYRPQGELVIVRNMRTTKAEQRDKPTLAWKFNIYAKAPVSRAYVYVDAHTGQIVLQDAIIKHADATGVFGTRYSGTQNSTTDKFLFSYAGKVPLYFHRLRDASRGSGIETYTARQSNSYANAIDLLKYDNIWTNYNVAPFSDAALDAHWGAQAVYDYWKNVHNRNSYDGRGAKIKSYVNFDDTPNDGVGMENAYWTGSEMLYGDGASTFQPLTSLDVCAHEIGHAICSSTANLVYQNESGALNEGFSDIWGAVVENYKAPSKQPWLIGEDIIKPTGYTCLRSMSEPASAGALSKAPAYYKGQYWYTGTGDYGGVHTNSGVLNHWFYILSVGKSGINEGGNTYSVTGIGIGAAANIAYRAESVYLLPNSNYADARTYTIEAATDLYGAGSPQVMATTNAWHAVGVGAAYTPPVTYCASKGTSVSHEWITLVRLGSIDRTSGPDGGYYDGTRTSTRVTAGSSQTISYSAGFARRAHTEYWKIYIDYNQDGDFMDSGEMVGSTDNTSSSPLSSSFTVPNTAKSGRTRLRVVMSGTSTTTTCGSFDYGETEDYTLVIIPPYCTSQGGPGSTLSIGSVRLGSIDRTSGPDAGYYDGTGTSTSVAAGSSQTISYGANFAQRYTIPVQYWKIYIDYNQDGDFTDSDETVGSRYITERTLTNSSSFTVPATARRGSTRLRVVMSGVYDPEPTSCGSFRDGETEDYTLIITGASAGIAGGGGSSGINRSAGLTRRLELYPNPASDVLRVLLPDNAPLVSVTLTDLRGAKVEGLRVEGDQLNVAALAKGIYTLTVSDGQKVFHQRFVKQ